MVLWMPKYCNIGCVWEQIYNTLSTFWFVILNFPSLKLGQLYICNTRFSSQTLHLGSFWTWMPLIWRSDFLNHFKFWVTHNLVYHEYIQKSWHTVAEINLFARSHLSADNAQCCCSWLCKDKFFSGHKLILCGIVNNYSYFRF